MEPKEVKEAIDGVGKAFNEFKATNDENLKKRDVLLDEKLDKITKELDRFEDVNQKLVLAQKQSESIQEQLDQVEGAINEQNLLLPGGQSDTKDAEFSAAFNRVLRKAADSRDPKDMSIISARMNALVKGDDAGAGYLLAPPELQSDIIKGVVLTSPMRALCGTRTIGSEAYKRPKRTGTGAASRVGEIAARTNTGDPSYGMVTIYAPEMFSRVELSLQMMEDTGYDLLMELREDSIEQFAKKEGLEAISGTGASNQMEGILTNADVAEVVSGAAATLKPDGLIDLWTALSSAYTGNSTFILNRATLGAIRKLKDTTNQYLWQPGIAGSLPNTILSTPYVEMPDMPDVGAGKYPIALGDFRRAFMMVDRIAVSFQADYTTGADNGLVVFRGRKRVGGGVMLAEAIKKLKVSA